MTEYGDLSTQTEYGVESTQTEYTLAVDAPLYPNKQTRVVTGPGGAFGRLISLELKIQSTSVLLY